jgi:hypothetical protein
MTAAKALSTLGTKEQPFRFIYVSGEGADQTEKSRQLFGRIKGRTERELDEAETGTFKTISVRPGAINPTAEVCYPPHSRYPKLNIGKFMMGDLSMHPVWV